MKEIYFLRNLAKCFSCFFFSGFSFFRRCKVLKYIATLETIVLITGLANFDSLPIFTANNSIALLVNNNELIFIIFYINSFSNFLKILIIMIWNRISLTCFKPMFHFYTSWQKLEKQRFQGVQKWNIGLK